VRFDAARSSALPPAARERLLALRDHRISGDGVVVIKAQQFRSQEQNKAAALERLTDLVRRALVVPKVRRKTKPTRASQARRLDNKVKHGRLKRERRTLDD
jgi:ribosome-associated protein